MHNRLGIGLTEHGSEKFRVWELGPSSQACLMNLSIAAVLILADGRLPTGWLRLPYPLGIVSIELAIDS